MKRKVLKKLSAMVISYEVGLSSQGVPLHSELGIQQGKLLRFLQSLVRLFGAGALGL